MNSFISNSKKKIVIMLFSFLVSCFAFIFYNQYSANDRDFKKHNIEKFWTIKTFINEEYDMLLFGNSRVYRGLNPSRDTKGRKIYNLGYSSAGLNPELISHYVEKNLKKNGTILLGISATTFMKTNFENKHWKQYIKLKPDEIFFNKNPNLKRLFSSIVKKKEKSKDEKDSTYQFYPETGFVASNSKVYSINKTFYLYESIFKEIKYADSTFLELLRYLKTLKGYKIYAFRVPSHLEIEKLEDVVAQFPFALVKDRLIQEGIMWLEVPFRDELKSYDGNHLDEESANRLSDFVFSQIQ